MEISFDGLLDNLARFRKAGVSNHEIVVVVVYDGLEKMNNENSNEKSMVAMFKDIDRVHKISEEWSMES